MYADVDGNIGYQMPGRIPIRASGDGQLPVPGLDGKHEWTGYVPFEELPSVYNPPAGYVATANNAVVGPDFKYLLGLDWDRGYRAQRIVEMILAKDKLSPEDFAAIQGDNVDLAAKQIVPYLQTVDADGEAQKVLDLIRNWDFVGKADRTGAGAYMAFFYWLLRNTFDDDLGDLAADYVNGEDYNQQALIGLLAQPNSHWWDDTETPQTETRDDILKHSLSDAAESLTAALGADPSGWTWGRLHRVTFAHQALADSPVEFIVNRGPFAVNGGSELVNAVSVSFDGGYDPDVNWLDVFAVSSGPSLRQIVDLGDLDKSLFINTVGQSGLPYHPHYEDMINLWLNIQYVPMRWERSPIEQNAEGTLNLTP